MRGARAPRALDASDCPITVCSHHLPRRIERCVKVMNTGVWGSAYYDSVHLAGATSHDLAEITIASCQLETLNLNGLPFVSPMSTDCVRRLVQKLLSTYLTRPAGAEPQNDG